MAAEVVEKRPLAQVVAFQSARAYRHVFDEMLKWPLLPFADAIAKLQEDRQALKFITPDEALAAVRVLMTTAGPIRASAAGLILPHEHLFTDLRGPDADPGSFGGAGADPPRDGRTGLSELA